jgi:uncharacterized protein (DUF2267 family)
MARCFPVPREYQQIRRDLYNFLERARDIADVGTTHQSYTMCQGVFQVFRRRLTTEDAIRFSNTLPAGIRSLFVAEWDPTIPKMSYASRRQLTQEVQGLRPSHNFAPNSCIADVAQALRVCLQQEDMEEPFQKCIESLGDEAEDFWKPKHHGDDE